MRAPIVRRNPDDLRREFPIEGVAPGWFFRIDEVSPGVYRGSGSDLEGRIVASTDTDPETVLANCKAAVLDIIRQS